MKKLLYLLSILAFISCTTKVANEDIPSQHIYTVYGKVPIAELSKTLIHEHVLVDFIGADSTGYHRWNRDSVVKKMLPYLQQLKEYGVETLIETTPMYLGRDPLLLKRLADSTGIQMITNTGLYGAVNDKYLPAYAFEISADSLSERWIEEFHKGIEETGIRPGFQKISVDPNSILSSVDKKIVIAAILTHAETGLTIVSHTGPDAPAFEQLQLLDSMRVDPSAWVWTHAQNGSDSGRIAAAKKGAWISLDNVMVNNYLDYVEMIDTLRREGLLNKVLISHDAGYYDPDLAMDTEIRPYTAIFTHLIPALKKSGYSKETIDTLLIINPAAAYAIEAPH
mgnify:CR=1 FL=1